MSPQPNHCESCVALTEQVRTLQKQIEQGSEQIAAVDRAIQKCKDDGPLPDDGLPEHARARGAFIRSVHAEMSRLRRIIDALLPPRTYLTIKPIDPLVTAVALSLYAYNVSPVKRAEHIYRKFNGACAEPDELVRAVMSIAPATELALPSAEVYVQHALETYQREAEDRVRLGLPDRRRA